MDSAECFAGDFTHGLDVFLPVVVEEFTSAPFAGGVSFALYGLVSLGCRSGHSSRASAVERFVRPLVRC